MQHTEDHLGDHKERNMEHLRNNSTGRLATETVRDGRVLVLYTGGTIGMIRNESGGILTFSFSFIRKKLISLDFVRDI